MPWYSDRVGKGNTGAEYTFTEIITALLDVSNKIGRVPLFWEYEYYRGYYDPTGSTVRKALGKWKVVMDTVTAYRHRQHTCDLCGADCLELHCKIKCPRCGYVRDCTDP